MVRLFPCLGGNGISDGSLFTFNVYIKTGDRPKAGTDANVFITLHGEGKQTDETKLDLMFHDDFERGRTDKYKIKNVLVGGDVVLMYADIIRATVKKE